MIRLARFVKGLGALALLAALVAGIPWALWHFVGWPLPHHIPTVGQVGRALSRQGIPDQALVDALAVVVWIAWATLVACLAIEIPAALSGRRAPHLPVAGIFQPLTGHLVAAVIVACLALAPRGLHPGPPGDVGTGLMTTAARQPIAALIVDDPTFTAASRLLQATPAPSVPPAQDPDPASAAATSAKPGPTAYVVQRGDTLWGIAERHLGDPLKWQTIYQLNEGRPQPGGVTLTDAHWIDPGWTLLLPATSAPVSAMPAPVTTPAAASAAPATTPTSTPTTSTPPTSTLPTSASPTTPSTSPMPTSPAATNGTAPRDVWQSAEPVQLPSGSVVAGSFVAGVLATLALGRLRRRHTYRYRPPEPGRDLTLAPHRPTLHHLHRAAPGEPDRGVTVDTDDGVPAFPVDDDERRLDPGRVDVGARDGATVAIELTELSGIALAGSTAADAVRALVAALIVRAGPGAAEVLLTDELADRLLPDLEPNLAIRRTATTDQAARAVEGERISRTRRMTAADAPDAARFRSQNPENPLPALLVLLDQLPAESLGRWEALVAGAARLGIAILFVDDCPAATGQLVVDNTWTVTHATPAHRAARLVGCQLFGLRADEAVELLGSVNDANRRPEEDEDEHEPGTTTPIIALYGLDETGAQVPAPVPEPWPEPNGLPPGLPEARDRPLAIDVLGPYRITAFGQPVTTGLRARAKTLLAWCLLRPEGATIDEIVDALWPKTPPDRILKQFWYPLGDLRAFFRAPGGENLEVLEKVGEHYRPNPAEITSDLWDFQAALSTAVRASADDQARAALHQAVDTYRGDLLQGAGYSWVEPVRQDLHRRAVDAHLRLAELEDKAGRPGTAIDVLERVIDLDRYAEEPYRRLMTLQAAHGRLDAVTATWKLLQRRVADLDVDTDDATTRLYHALTTASIDPARPRPIRLPS